MKKILKETSNASPRTNTATSFRSIKMIYVCAHLMKRLNVMKREVGGTKTLEALIRIVRCLQSSKSTA